MTEESDFYVRAHSGISSPVDGQTDALTTILGIPPEVIIEGWRKKWSNVLVGATSINPVLSPRKPRHRLEKPVDQEAIPIQSWIWSGVIVTPSIFDGIKSVSGSWTVPNAYFPSGVPMACAASTWVGIGGHFESDLVQAGCDVASSGAEFFVTPWFEWVPGYTKNIDNLPIAIGDEVFVLIWSPVGTLSLVNIMFFNVSQQHYVHLSIQAPPGVIATGKCAEWIVEMIDPYNGPDLARYASVTFTDCLATTIAEQSISAQDGQTIDMVVGGSVVSSGAIVGPNAVRVINTSPPIKRLP